MGGGKRIPEDISLLTEDKEGNPQSKKEWILMFRSLQPTNSIELAARIRSFYGKEIETNKMELQCDISVSD